MLRRKWKMIVMGRREFQCPYCQRIFVTDSVLIETRFKFSSPLVSCPYCKKWIKIWQFKEDSYEG